MPKVDDGTYVVTWRVTSADAHPVQGAFTFQVGAKGSVKNADALAKRLLASQGGSTTVGVVYAIDRVAIFATLALLIGGIVFLSVVFPVGRDSRRAQRIVWGGWIGVGRRDHCRHRARGHLRVGAAAHEDLRPVRVRRRARHAVRARVARAPRAARARLPAAQDPALAPPGLGTPVAEVVARVGGVPRRRPLVHARARGPRRHRRSTPGSPFRPTPSTCWRWRAGWAGW